MGSKEDSQPSHGGLQEKVCGVRSSGGSPLLSSASLQERGLITAGVAKGLLPSPSWPPLSVISSMLLAPPHPGSHVVNVGLRGRQWSIFSCQSAEPGSGQIFILPLDQHSIEPMAGFEPGSRSTKGLC